MNVKCHSSLFYLPRPKALFTSATLEIICRNQGPKKGLTDARSAVRFCLGSGLFGSYNSD